MSTFAPVVIFCYRRAEKLRKMLNRLMRCEGFDCSPLIVDCDDLRDLSEVAAVTAIREFAKSMLGGRAEYHFSRSCCDLNFVKKNIKTASWVRSQRAAAKAVKQFSVH